MQNSREVDQLHVLHLTCESSLIKFIFMYLEWYRAVAANSDSAVKVLHWF